MRPRSHVTLKERRRLTISGFRGVDLTSSPLEVAANRASYMRNFINDGGINHKRPGWREIAILNAPINGIFEYVDGDVRETIIQAGARFYRLRDDSEVYDITRTCTYPPAALDLSIIDPAQRSQGFMLNGSLYIIGCGDLLVYEYCESSGRRELRRVFNNESTYIPTTTVGIVGEGNISYEGMDGSVIKPFAPEGGESLEDVNMLRSERKNLLIGAAVEYVPGMVNPPALTEIKYQLDGCVKPGTIVEIEAVNGATVRCTNGTNGVSREPGTYIIRNSADDYVNLYEINADGSKGMKVGRVGQGEEAYYIWLYCLYSPPIEMDANITVTFTPDEDIDPSSVTGCRLGVRFGTERISDRLFLGGSPSAVNVDRYSEESDFTYFGELSYAVLGDSSTSIEGYAKLSDSSLVIYKSESNTEPSFFFRTAKYYDEYDDAGNLQYLRGIFPHTEGGVGEGVISRYAHGNLCGDTVFLSRSGVHGIVLSENMLTTERYMRERSRNIRSALANRRDLSEAVGIVYNNRYYLAIDGICYVGDARYKFEAPGDIDGSYNYEWWVWDNIPARVFAQIGTDLYYGTEDGRIRVFDNEYTDRTYDRTKAGELMIDNAVGNMIYNTTNERLNALSEGDRITFISDGVFALLDEGMTVSEGRIYSSETALLSIFDGMEVYAGEVGSSGLAVNVKYTVGDIDRGNSSYALFLNGAMVTPSSGGFRLFVSLSGEQLFIGDDPKDGRFSLRRHSEGELLRLAVYESAALSIIAVIEHRRNVVAEWVTPVTDLGTNAESKTLIGMTVSARPVRNGRLSFGYETRNADRMIESHGMNTFSLRDLSFVDFSFDTGFQNSYTVRCRERNFNYIVFRFISDSDTDCVINGLTVDYKLNKKNKGVR